MPGAPVKYYIKARVQVTGLANQNVLELAEGLGRLVEQSFTGLDGAVPISRQEGADLQLDVRLLLVESSASAIDALDKSDDVHPQLLSDLLPVLRGLGRLRVA